MFAEGWVLFSHPTDRGEAKVASPMKYFEVFCWLYPKAAEKDFHHPLKDGIIAVRS